MANQPAYRNFHPKKNPITSYGIILIHIDDNDVIWYLLSQRRDTIEYADFLRGRYSYINLEPYFKLMTNDERKRLETYPFDELWDDLWVNHNNRFYREVRPKAKAKYNTNAQIRCKLLKETRSNITEPSWGFPKGKKNLRETEIECAFREFIEETKMSLDHTNLMSLAPSTEVFKGSNGKMYSTVYYIAKVDHKIPIKKMPIQGLRTETISEEISNLRWCTIDDAVPLLKPWRKKVLLDSRSKIKTRINDKLWV